MNTATPRFETIPPRLWKLLFYVPGIFLILFVLINRNTTPYDELLAQWKTYRNLIYKLFVGLIHILMLALFTPYKHLPARILPVTFLSLLLTIFSFAIALLMLDLLNVFRLIILSGISL